MKMRSMRGVAVLAVLLGCTAARARENGNLKVDGAETAVLDPVHWDGVFAGERYFDAVRPLLVRFPDATEAVLARMQAGERIVKLELVLEWERQEGPRPRRGRHGWGADEQYAANPGEWSVVAHALLRPWAVADDFPGPTFNAYLDGLGYWDRGGARGDGSDRHPRRVGPLPLYPEKAEPVLSAAPAVPSTELDPRDNNEFSPEALLEAPRKPPVPTARLDFTWALNDPAFGSHPAERFGHLASRGFRVSKHEIRDMKYRRFWAYDWAVSTAYMRIWVRPPRLEITFRPGGKTGEVVPASPSPRKPTRLLETLRAEGARGTPSIALPADWSERVRSVWRQPDGVPDWQWRRVLELKALGRVPEDTEISLGKSVNWNALFSDDPGHALEVMRAILRIPPRTWFAHLSSDFALLPAACPDLLPPGVMDHLKLYWKAWLHPETPDRKDIGGGRQRGGPSYFRGYSNGGGTMNFGHNAVMGALLGSQLIDAEYPLAEARRGVENLLRRNNGFGTGAHQEIGDTYYQALSIAAAGAIAKYAENPDTRMMGKFHLDRLLEPLVSMYHPGLRRMTHPMGRGSYLLNLVMQEGPYHVLHTLSPKGVLMHLEDLHPPAERHGTPKEWGSVRNLPILGNEAPPNRIALISPWTEPWLADTFAGVVDDKTFPWRIHARDYSPGCNGGGWHVNYLSRDYALASRDNANVNYGVTSIIAQWRRRNERVEQLDDLSTMIIGFGGNQRFMEAGKSMGTFGVLQHDNKLIGMKNMPGEDLLPRNKFGHMHAVHASAAIFATGDVSERELWINDRKIDAFGHPQADFPEDWATRIELGPESVDADEGDRILIRDGVTYLCLIPITVNPRPRRRAAAVSFNAPVLMIHAYLYDVDYVAWTAPEAPNFNADEVANDKVANDAMRDIMDELKPPDQPRPTPESKLIRPEEFVRFKETPVAGFVLEMGDATQYPSFDAFRAHMLATQLETRWNGETRQVEIRYRSDGDLLEMDFDPLRYPVPRRAINGAWPYLPGGIMRASEWAIQGSTGELERHGAVLRSKPGQHAYLQAVPATDTFIAYNPTPDLTPWSFTVPGGIEVRADGEIGMIRVAVRPKEKRVWIDQVYRSNQIRSPKSSQATGLLMFGFDLPPETTLNGRAFEKLEPVQVEGRQGFRLSFEQPQEG